MSNLLASRELSIVRADQAFDTIIEREYDPRLSQQLGKHALDGTGILFASDYPVALQQADQRNQQLMIEVPQVGVEIAVATDRPAGTTLRQRLELSAQGDAEADAALEMDSKTEVTEQMCKAGAVLKVEAKINDENALEQFGQTTEIRQRNTLRTYGQKNTVLGKTLSAEGRNGFFIEEAYKQGLLEGKRVVEVSFIPEGSQRDLAKHGYYLREVIAILRVTTIKENGDCEIVSVLFGGTDQSLLPAVDTLKTEAQEAAAERLALQNRFDLTAGRALYGMLGKQDAEQLDSAELLGEPMIIDDKYDHIDLMMLLDGIISKANGGKAFFFGLPPADLAKRSFNRADYVAHEQQSLAFQANLKTVAASVKQEAIARRHEAKTDLETAKLFREIAKNKAVDHLLEDKMADIRVFGARTYHRVVAARQQIAVGDIMGAQASMYEAKKVAKATGCPDPETKSATQKLLRAAKNILKSLTNKVTGKEEDDEEADIPDEIRCIKCDKKSPKEEVIQKDTWRCPCCHYEVNICDGEEVHPSESPALQAA